MTKKVKFIKNVLWIVIMVITIISLASIPIKSLSADISLENEKKDEIQKINQRESKSEKESEPIFTLYKQDGETYEPIAGTKFIITDLEGKNVVDTNGKIVGTLENIDGIDYYVLTTDQNGLLTVNLPQGIYKAIEVYATEGYVLEEEESNRTYYFKIGLSNIDLAEWINGVNGYSWNMIQSVTTNNQGEIMAVGSISEYLPDVAGAYYDGVDLNSDGIIDEVSQGNKDGIIVVYDEEGNYLWSQTFGGKGDESCNKIIQTRDGGYMIVGYTSSTTIYLNEKILTDLSQSNYDLKNKDGFLLKLNSDGNYEWGIRIGGTLDDEIIKASETTAGDIAIIGNFVSKNFHFYENSILPDCVKTLANDGKQNSFIALYSAEGKYKWSQKIGGNDYCEITDITEVEENLTIAVNYKGTIKIGENHSLSSYLPDYQDGLILNYSLEGILNWNYEIYAAPTNLYSDYKYVRIDALSTTKENTIAVAMECTDIIKGRKGKEDYKTIYTCQSGGIIADVFLLSHQGEYIKNIYDLSAAIGTLSASSATVVFQDMINTTDNQILLGGYYYSEKSIDVDKDGSASGEYDFKSANKYRSNGFVIKLDLEGNVNFSDCMYRKDRELYAPSNITCVEELNGKKIIAGGNFFWETATTKNFYRKDSEEEPNYISRIGNIDSFVFLENINQNTSELIEKVNLTINNFKKKYTITTEVKSHPEGEEEVKGGKITGEYNQTIDGVEYTEEGIHYVETVKYGESSTKDIIITPDKGYKIDKITINGEDYVDFSIDDNGNVLLPQFSNITNNLHIVVTFSQKIIHFYELPITGANDIIVLDLISVILICLGILKFKKTLKSSKN